jgi:hypothetical protein
MKNEGFLKFVVVVVFVVSLFSSILTYFSVSNLVTKITGYQTGEANLTVETIAQVNFSTRAISWGSGRVNSDANAASLTTFGTLPNVTGGNWTLTTAGGLRIENIGNTNVSLNFSVNKNASDFIGGTNPIFEWNLTNVEAASCRSAAGNGDALRMNIFFQANTTSSLAKGGIGCSVFRFENANDLVRLDFNLTVPQDSKSGALGVIITSTVTALDILKLLSIKG